MRPAGPVLLYGGVALAAAGFALIAFTWGQVAGLESVALQLPYIVSGGLTGLGLVIVGATTVNVYAKQREGAQRERQAQQLTEILRQVTIALGGTLPPQPGENGDSSWESAEGGGSTPPIDRDDVDGTDLGAADEGHTEELLWGK